MTMGDMIKYQRIKLELSQEELGQKLEPPVFKAAINKWENGTVENIKRTHIKQMADLFGITPCDLMCWNDTSATVVKKDDIQDELCSILAELNQDGKNEVLQYAHYILTQDKFISVKKESLNA